MSKSIFIVSQKSQISSAIALHIQDHIDDMLQILGTSDFTTFGDMPNNNNCHLCSFCQIIEKLCTRPHLPRRTRISIMIMRHHSLDTIHDNKLIPIMLDRISDRFHMGCIKKIISLTMIRVQSRISLHDLRRGFFSRKIRPLELWRGSQHIMNNLQGKSRFTNTRLSCKEIERISYKSIANHPFDFFVGQGIGRIL